MKVHMIVGDHYPTVVTSAQQFARANNGIVVSVEALYHFSCELPGSGQSVIGNGDPQVFVARINS